MLENGVVSSLPKKLRQPVNAAWDQYIQKCILSSEYMLLYPMGIRGVNYILGNWIATIQYGKVRYSMQSMHSTYSMYSMYSMYNMYCTVFTVFTICAVCTTCTVQYVQHVQIVRYVQYVPYVSTYWSYDFMRFLLGALSSLPNLYTWMYIQYPRSNMETYP